jgi:hypothetical protein
MSDWDDDDKDDSNRDWDEREQDHGECPDKEAHKKRHHWIIVPKKPIKVCYHCHMVVSREISPYFCYYCGKKVADDRADMNEWMGRIQKGEFSLEPYTEGEESLPDGGKRAWGGYRPICSQCLDKLEQEKTPEEKKAEEEKAIESWHHRRGYSSTVNVEGHKVFTELFPERYDEYALNQGGYNVELYLPFKEGEGPWRYNHTYHWFDCARCKKNLPITVYIMNITKEQVQEFETVTEWWCGPGSEPRRRVIWDIQNYQVSRKLNQVHGLCRMCLSKEKKRQKEMNKKMSKLRRIKKIKQMKRIHAKTKLKMINRIRGSS